MPQKPPLTSNRKARNRRYPSLGSGTTGETAEAFHLRKQKEHAATEHESEGSMQNFDFKREVVTRLRRIETRVVKGMEDLGANVVDRGHGIGVVSGVGGDVGTISITSLGTTVKELLEALGERTGTYDIVYNGKTKIQVTTNF